MKRPPADHMVRWAPGLEVRGSLELPGSQCVLPRGREGAARARLRQMRPRPGGHEGHQQRREGPGRCASVFGCKSLNTVQTFLSSGLHDFRDQNDNEKHTTKGPVDTT